MKKTKKFTDKFICMLLILIFILPNLFPIISVAATPMNEAHLKDKGSCGRHLQYFNSDRQAWSYIVCDYVAYEYEGREYTAYCINSKLPGIRYITWGIL